MKTYSVVLIAILHLPILAFTGLSHAEDANVDFAVDTGFEHDSNVNVQELDTVAEASDVARLLNARLNGRWQATDKLTLKAGFSHAGKDYRQFKDFSQTVNTLSGDIAYDFYGTDVGTSIYQAKADLASDPFLELNQRSLYAGKLFNQRIYVRAAYNWREKSFVDAIGRNADSTGADADVFFFFNNANSFLSVGLSQEQENARSSLFDNDAFGFRGRLSNKFVLWGKNSQIQLGMRALNRDYTTIDPGLDARRQDTRKVVDARWELSLNSVLSTIATIERGNYQSTLDSADYDETVAAIQLKASF
jgi:hypothetical protein